MNGLVSPDKLEPNNAEAAVGLPPVLAHIREQARWFLAHRDERARTADGWAQRTLQLQQATPRAIIEDGGVTVRLGELSPGCRACKSGHWDCLFLSMSCNLACSFCLTPCQLTKPAALSALGDDWDALCDQYANSDTTGVGFSGGEPLLEPDRLLRSVAKLRTLRPDIHLWAYTNGLLLTPELIKALAQAGLNELRFNMAATGYRHPHVSAMLGQAAAVLPTVTVEIPAIPRHAARLQKALPVWARLGVKHLNLHELIHEPGTPSETMPGARTSCRMPDGHVCAVSPRSSHLVANVLREVDAAGLSIAVNYCSLQSKARQLQDRRRRLAPRTLQAYERLRDDGEAESVCYFSATGHEFTHPAKTAHAARPPGWGVAVIRRLLPLVPEDTGQWTHFEVLQEPVTS